MACQRQVFGDVQAAMLLCNDVLDVVEEFTVPVAGPATGTMSAAFGHRPNSRPANVLKNKGKHSGKLGLLPKKNRFCPPVAKIASAILRTARHELR